MAVAFQASLRDAVHFLAASPGVETPGYCQQPLRGWFMLPVPFPAWPQRTRTGWGTRRTRASAAPVRRLHPDCWFL